MRAAKITGAKYVKYLKEVMADNGYADNPADMHTFLVTIGKLSTPKKAQSKYSSYQSGKVPPVEIRESWKFGRVIYLLESHLATAQISWATVKQSVDAGVLASVIENEIGQFNEDFARVFSGIVKVTALDPGETNWMTAAAFKFLMGLDDREEVNPFLSATVSGDSTDAILIS